MKTFLKYFTFVIASVVIAVIFITSTSYTQLAIGTLLYPPLAYFAFTLFPRKKRNDATQASAAVEPTPIVATVNNSVDIVDIDKRAFLKLIGAAGLSFFIFSLFTRRAEGLFFGKALESGTVTLKDPTGKDVYPAESQPTDGYQICEIDDNFISFYGFTNKEGNWFIMKEDTDSGSFRYAKGDVDFSLNWVNREQLSYDYFHNAFRA